MGAASLPRFTAREYLEQERKAEFRSEYFDGQMFAMAGGTSAHARVMANVQSEIHQRLKGKPCTTYSSDLRIRTGADRLYTYADTVVVCGRPEFADDQKDTLLNPSVIVEVLSDSTEASDRGFKFHQYQTIDSLQEYVLVSQREPRVEVFRRVASNQWQLTQFEGLEASARIHAIDCEIPLAEIYAEPFSA